MEIIKMTLPEWQAEGESLFGKDRMLWKFVCPVCETVIEVRDYKNSGAPEGAIAFSCIGRYLDKKQECFTSKKIKKGKPCNYAGFGLFSLNPVEIEGMSERFFDFYRYKAAGKYFCSSCDCEITKEQYEREPTMPNCDTCDIEADPT